MKGSILIYDNDTKRGVILDSQNNEYDFYIGEWLSEKPIVMGEEVSFEIPREEAININTSDKLNFFKKFFWKRGKSFFNFVYSGRD